MFERFTDRARRVMTLANQEAQRLGHDHVGTEHLLLGLVKESSGTAADILNQFRVDVGKVRQQVEQMGHGPSDKPPSTTRTPTDRYKRVLNYAIVEAGSLSNNYVGTEHLLLGLLREPEGTAARVLAGLNLKLDEVRASVLNLLGRAPIAKDTLLSHAMKDLALHLADERFDPAVIRSAAEALINAGWRPQQ
jgi:ATP-dependent Clp protease ATP-binding subunit ClpC